MLERRPHAQSGRCLLICVRIWRRSARQAVDSTKNAGGPEQTLVHKRRLSGASRIRLNDVKGRKAEAADLYPACSNPSWRRWLRVVAPLLSTRRARAADFDRQFPTILAGQASGCTKSREWLFCERFGGWAWGGPQSPNSGRRKFVDRHGVPVTMKLGARSQFDALPAPADAQRQNQAVWLPVKCEVPAI